MKRKEYISEITKLLAILRAEVDLSAPNNFTDINIHSENFYCELLNILYDYNLENANAEQQNAAGYDLGDKGRRVAIQITSTSGIKKTRDTVDTFIKNELYKDYDRLIILNISRKSIHQEVEIGEKGKFLINTREDIWDSSNILRDISNLSSVNLKEVYDFVREELSSNRSESTKAQSARKNESDVPREDRLLIESQKNSELLRLIASKVGVNTSDGIGLIGTSQDNSGFSTQFDSEIDGYRDLLRDGQPQTALKLLQALEGRLPEGVDARISYRVKANISACYLSLDEYDIAGQGYLDAYALSPEAPKADAHKTLGLVLLGKSKEALEFGVLAQSTTKDLESLVAHTIMALKDLPEEQRSLDFIPDTLSESETILVSRVDLLRYENKRTDWRDLAKRAHELYLENPILERFYAESILDRVFEDWDNAKGGLSLPTLMNDVNLAIKILEKNWQNAQKWENKSDSVYFTLATNLSSAYRFIGRVPEATDILDEGLKRAPDDEELLEKRLAIAFETNDKEKVSELLPKLPITRNNAMGRIQTFFNDEDWDAVCSLPSYTTFSDFSNGDKAFYDAVQFAAQFKSGAIADPKVECKSLFDRHKGQFIIPVILFSIASELEDKIWAETLYESAKSLQDGESMNSKLMLADISEELGDYSNIIELFEGKILMDRDNRPLRFLASAYVNCSITQNAVSFANKLGGELLKNAYYARVKASIEFNYGALKDAQKSFSDALKISKNDVTLNIGYVNTLIRRGEKAKAKNHLGKINLRDLEGAANIKLGIAQLLLSFGYEQKALDYGYEVALTNQGNEQVVLFYMGLILPNSSKLSISTHLSTVDEDCWIVLENQEGKETDFIITDKIRETSLDHYPLSHELSKALLGKKRAEIVEIFPSMGTKSTYKIKEIKHRYIGLLHSLMNNFSKRFPNSKEISSYTTVEGDVQPILDDIKRISEAEEKIYKLYIEQKLPLSFLSGFSRFNVIEFANRIVTLGHLISTNIGTDEERSCARQSCQKAISSGVVLDTYTLWVCHTNGLIPLLKKFFGRLVIPQSAIDTLQEWRAKFENVSGEALLTVGYEDGQHFKEEIQPEKLNDSKLYIDNAIKFFHNNIDILPAAPCGVSSKLEVEVLSTKGCRNILDAGYIAQQEKLLLLSEDMSLRSIIKQELDVDGVWIQVVLMECLEDRDLDLDEYSEAVYALAQLKHGHLALSADVLLSLCQKDQSLIKYKVALDFIGGTTADVKSHISVSTSFIEALWGSDLDRLTKCQATSLILEKLAVMCSRHGFDVEVLKKIATESSSAIRKYIEGWFYGHYFMSLKEV